MDCELSHTLLHGYLDGELDAGGATNFERHLESCPQCSEILAKEQSLRESLQRSQLYERAPANLHHQVRSSLPALAPASAPRFKAWFWLAMASAALLLALLGWQSLSLQSRHSQQSAFASAVIDAHLRSLQPGHLTDVESTDQHTVKPWFDGRLDFAPPVRDFASEGFPLTGGRLDVVDGKTVAALVYGRRKHFVNVFVWKADNAKPWAGSGTEQGYQWLAWRSADLYFCAVSDTAPADLEQLKQLFLQN
jgi:anti-sigma factor (TIGR02949 family)